MLIPTRFLLARLYMDILTTGTTTASVLREKLSSFRSVEDGSIALDAAYDGILAMIERQGLELADMALRALAGVAFASQPLTDTELRHSLALKADMKRLEEEDNLIEADEIVKLCCGLLGISKGHMAFLTHRTVGEYLRSNEVRLHSANKGMAESCITYLCFPEFANGPVLRARWFEASELDELIKTKLLLRHASSSWARYLSRADPSSIPQLLRRCAAYQKNLQLSFQVHLMPTRKLFPKNLTLAHIISYLGSPDFISILKTDKCLDRRASDSSGKTALHWAVEREDGVALDMAKKLLDLKFDVNTADRDGRTPLGYAARSGSLELVNLLLEKKARTKADRKTITPLVQACLCGHAEVAQALLEHGADVNAECGSQDTPQTPLLASIMGGSEECVAVVLASRRLEKSRGTYEFGTALHQAAYYSSSEIVRKLLDAGFDVNISTGNNGTPLQTAVAGAHKFSRARERTEVIKLLLDRGAEVDAHEGPFGTALDAARRNGNKEVEKLLQNYGAKRSTEFMPRRRDTAMSISENEFIRGAMGKYGGHFLVTLAAGNDKLLQQQIDMRIALFKSAIRAKHVRNIKFHSYFSVIAFEAMVKQARRDFEKEEALRLGGDSAIKRRPRLGSLTACFASVLNFTVRRRVPEQANDQAEDGFRTGRTTAAKLELMTSAAVKILSDAIEEGDEEIVQLLSRTWVDALKNMFVADTNGMIAQELIYSRAREFEGFFRDNEMDKAHSMAMLALELMSSALKGTKSDEDERKKLALALAEIWSRTLRNVIEKRYATYEQLEQFFRGIKKVIASEIENLNWPYIKRLGPSIVEVLAGVVADNNMGTADIIAQLVVEGWQLAIDKGMIEVDQVLVREFEIEFEESIKPLGDEPTLKDSRMWMITGAIFKVLCSAVHHDYERIQEVVSTLIISNFYTLHNIKTPRFVAIVRDHLIKSIPIWFGVDSSPVYLLEGLVAFMSVGQVAGFTANLKEDTREIIARILSDASENLDKLEARTREVLLSPNRRDEAALIKNMIRRLREHLGAGGMGILPGLRDELETPERT